MRMKKERNIFMTKLSDTLKNKAKTLYELAKELPSKTYRELEKYRDADRQEEAQQIFTQQDNQELKEEQVAKEADALMINKIIKYEAKITELQSNLDRIKKENNNLYERIAKLTEKDLQRARESGM